jgi:hypothetical protein
MIDEPGASAHKMVETNAADSFFSCTASRAISRNRPGKVMLIWIM